MTRISTLTGKESRAFIVRRIVLGCLSRDGGPWGECAPRHVKGRREGSKGDGGRRERGTGGQGREGGEGREGREGERGEKSAEWGTRIARVLEDNRHAGYDLHQVRCHRPSLLALCLSTSPPIQLLQAIFP